MPEDTLQATGNLSKFVLKRGIRSLSKLMDHIQHLSYQRISDKSDLRLVISEGRGTCSTKHAFIKAVCDEQNLDQLKLMIGIYKMDHLNTPGIGSSISDAGLPHMPEAHCYLKLGDQRIDLTKPDCEALNFEPFLISEVEIQAHQINTYKVDYHKSYIDTWRKEQQILYSLEELWLIRESCIQQLSRP